MSHSHNSDAMVVKLEKMKEDSIKTNELRIRVSTEVERLTTEKEKLEKDFIAKYGTSNIDELSAILSNQIEENDKLVADFEKDLQEANSALTKAQQEIAKLNALG